MDKGDAVQVAYVEVVSEGDGKQGLGRGVNGGSGAELSGDVTGEVSAQGGAVEARSWKVFILATLSIIIYMTASLQQLLGQPLLLIQRVCDDMHAASCDDHEVSSRVAQWSLVIGLGSSITSVIAAGTLGVWSDRHGRRPPLVASCVGLLLNCAYLLVFTVYKLPIWTLVVSSCVTGFGGGSPAYFMATFASVSDVSVGTRRTTWFGVTESGLYMGIVVGSTSAGVLASRIGFEGLFVTAMGLVGLAMGVVLLMPEPLVPARRAKTLDWSRMNVLSAISVLGAKSKLGGRLASMALASAFTISYSAIMGFSAVLILFTKVKFGWSDTDVSLFVGGQWLSRSIGIAVAAPFLHRMQQLAGVSRGDVRARMGKLCAAVTVALCAQCVAMALYAYAPSWEWMVAGAIVGGMSAMTFPAMRVQFSLGAPDDAQGTVLAGVSACETISQIVFPAIANGVYSATNRTCVGCTYWGLCAMLGLAVLASLVQWSHLASAEKMAAAFAEDDLRRAAALGESVVSETKPLLAG